VIHIGKGADACNCNLSLLYQTSVAHTDVRCVTVTNRDWECAYDDVFYLFFQKPKIDDDVFYLFLQKQKTRAEPHICLEEGTYHHRMFRGPITNDMKK
jgi:hypothetical protein